MIKNWFFFFFFFFNYYVSQIASNDSSPCIDAYIDACIDARLCMKNF